ncbi:methionyl-tRNA formyltransferase [Haloarchaeobius sp. DFWS5]|uniref:methionyl-tRNA formyltransferase n=1 Tax=Haloarchaeobius sp. DFWS5 TaxID=3446114 RepID=UPI003EBD2A78
MSDTEVVFLGVNDAGMRIYEWLCDKDGVTVHALVTTKEQLSLVERLKPDYLVSVGYRHIVPPSTLSVPSEGCINVHPALLPYNRGANPNVWSIVDGTPAGVTIHQMDENLDTGDVLAQEEVDTTFADTGRTLYERLEDVQYDLFVETWPQIEDDTVSQTAQSADEGTYHRLSDFDELCNLDPEETTTVRELLDRLRALTFPPYDNATIEINGESYYVDVDIEPTKD